VFVHHHSILFIGCAIRKLSTDLSTTKKQKKLFEIKYYG
jgi:hypothetical protein